MTLAKSLAPTGLNGPGRIVSAEKRRATNRRTQRWIARAAVDFILLEAALDRSGESDLVEVETSFLTLVTIIVETFPLL